MNMASVKTLVSLIVLLVLSQVLSDAFEKLWDVWRAQFPAMHAAWGRVVVTVAPGVLLGLLVYYGVQTGRAFRAGIREASR